MKPLVSAFSAGALFALGLGLSGMTQPAKIIGFLDVTGAWDPTLALVLIGALATHVVLLRAILRRRASVFGGAFQIPTRKDLDVKLVAGAAIFGVGWGLAGYCPGPAIASLATLAPPVLVFVAAMTAGMAIHKLTADLWAAAPRSARDAGPTPGAKAA